MTTRAAELINHGPSLFLRFIYLMSIVAISYVTLQWSFYQLAPMSLWVQYESIEPKEPVIIGKPLKFVTTASVRFSSNLKFSDTLFCDRGDGLGMVFIHNYSSERLAIPPRPAVPKAWKYADVDLNVGDKCQLESVITQFLPYSITKQTRMLGPIFEPENSP